MEQKRILMQIAVIVIAYFIIGIPLTDIMNFPKVMSIQENDKACPGQLKLYSGDAPTSFSLTFRNVGDDGNIFVTIDSNKLLSRAKERDEYKSSSTRQFFVENKITTTFNFQLMQKENIEDFENITINSTYGFCETIFGIPICKPYRILSCSYQKEASYTSNYNLHSEIYSFP